jgi:hypothetical protein
VKILPGLTLEQATDLLAGTKQQEDATKKSDPTIQIYSSTVPEKGANTSVSDNTPAFVKVEAADLTMIDVATGCRPANCPWVQARGLDFAGWLPRSLLGIQDY